MLKVKKFVSAIGIGVVLAAAVSGCSQNGDTAAEIVEPPAVMDPQSPVTLPETLNSGTVLITGVNQVGSTLTATPYGFVPAPVSYSYTWYRGLTVIGHEQKYQEVAADAGKTLTVQVEANYTGEAGMPGAIASSSIEVSPEIPIPPNIKPMPMPTVDPIIPNDPMPITPGVDPVLPTNPGTNTPSVTPTLPANPGTNTPSVTPTLPANPTPMPVPSADPVLPDNPTPAPVPSVDPVLPTDPTPAPVPSVDPVLPTNPGTLTPEVPPLPAPVQPPNMEAPLAVPPTQELPAPIPTNPTVEVPVPGDVTPCPLVPGLVADTPKARLSVGETKLGRMGKLTRDAQKLETPCSELPGATLPGSLIDPSAPVGTLPVTPEEESLQMTGTQKPSNKLMPAPKLSPQLTGGKVSVTQDGSVLTATVTGFSPEPTSLDYQWFRNDEIIPGATEDTYDSNGESLTDGQYAVRVIAHHDGYTDHLVAGFFNHVPPTGLVRK